jgi:hemin uptake protein HemP
MSDPAIRPPDLPGTDQAPKVRSVREIPSVELLRGETELLIRHGDELYRLKLTRNGKLILQK